MAVIFRQDKAPKGWKVIKTLKAEDIDQFPHAYGDYRPGDIVCEKIYK